MTTNEENNKDIEEAVEGLDERDTATSEASKYFEINEEGHLVVTVRGFGGDSKKEQQKRLIVLYGWAYRVLCHKPVPNKEHFINALREVNLYDDNFRGKYATGTFTEYFFRIGETYKLSGEGDKKAELILADMRSGKKGYCYWNGVKKRAVKITRTTKEEAEQINEWIKQDIDIGELDVKKLGAKNQAMFALWCLTKRLEVAKAIKPAMAHLYLTHKFTTISGERDSFTAALRNDRNKEVFARNQEGECYLTAEAETEVELWIAGTKKPGDGEKEAK